MKRIVLLIVLAGVAFLGWRSVSRWRTRTAYEGFAEAWTHGDLELEVHQTIFFDPPGITSAIGGAMYTGIHHSATLRNTPNGWRVIGFEPRFVDMGPLRRR